MKHFNIALLLPSSIVVAGIRIFLSRIPEANSATITLPESNFMEQLLDLKPSVLIADPLMISNYEIDTLKQESEGKIRIVGIYTQAMPMVMARAFDDVISVYDSEETVMNTLRHIIVKRNENDETPSLSQREKDVVVGIVKGLSNKEIATEMNVSVNTVMTHRRNIASKLQIHSPAGLTIYAIVSKLVRLDEIKSTLPI